MKINKINRQRNIALFQIFLLVVGIMAISYAVGEIGKSQGIKVSHGVGFVSGENEKDKCSLAEISSEKKVCSDDKKTILQCKCPMGNTGPNRCGKENATWHKIQTCSGNEKCMIMGNGNVMCMGEKQGDNGGAEISGQSDANPKQSPTPNCPPGEGPYEVGDRISSTNENNKKIHTIRKKDIDENGCLKKFQTDSEGNPTDKLVPWLTGFVADYAEGKLTTGLDKLLKGGNKEGLGKTLKAIIKGQKELFSKTGDFSMGNLLNAFAGAIIGAAIVYGVFKLAGADERNMRRVLGAAIGGVAIGTGTAMLVTIAGSVFISGLIFGALATLAITAFVYKNYSKETFSYIVTAWKPKSGGEDCDKCNDLRYGCSEYQCRSFGSGCELENGGTKDEVCVWKNPKDITPPVITALESVLPLPKEDYSWQPLEVTQGVKLTYSKDPKGKGCLPAYSSVTLGIKTDEFANCKIDSERTPEYKDMVAPMQKVEGLDKEHVLFFPHIATPSVEAQENAGLSDTQITNGEAQEFFIRCEDPNGNSNVEEYVMEFCVQDGPDTQAPLILGTNFQDEAFIKHNQSSVDLEVYTNEPAECKWDFDDKDYEQMQFGMDQCSMSEGEYLFSGYKYGCVGVLDGLKDRTENKYYIRCKDKPWWSEGDNGQRFANENSKVLTLKGTEPVLIDSITINGKANNSLIKDSTNTVDVEIEVKTSAGADDGKAKCAYQFSGSPFVDFYNGGDLSFLNINKQNLYLGEGSYDIPIKCRDAGGNTAQSSVSFSIEKDKSAPKVVRAYYDVSNLRIITDEPAECVYTSASNVGCDYKFDDAEAMNKIGENNHYVSWTANTKYYIKCKDSFGNRALPGECSAIVNAYGSQD